MHLDDFELYYYFSPTQEKVKQNVFFAHTNGIPALTYKVFLEKLSHDLNLNIVTYDIRGIGKTKIKENILKDKWSWQTLVDDHIFIFEQLKRKLDSKAPWVLAGHSLGSWLSLLSAEKLNIAAVWLFDPPILKPNIILKWLIISLLNRKDLSPNSQKVRKRRTRYPSYDAAYAQLKKSSFMKNWSKEFIYNYLEGSFSQEDGYIQLRHNPDWEGHLFEEYPPTASLGFLRVSFSFRKRLKPLFFIGEKSDTCNPQSRRWVKLFFPSLKWIPIPNGSHMFPIELPDQTIKYIAKVI